LTCRNSLPALCIPSIERRICSCTRGQREAETTTTDANTGIVRSFVRELRAGRKSPRTIQSYQEPIRRRGGHLASPGSRIHGEGAES
jgi:hypothetical protein